MPTMTHEGATGQSAETLDEDELEELDKDEVDEEVEGDEEECWQA